MQRTYKIFSNGRKRYSSCSTRLIYDTLLFSNRIITLVVKIINIINSITCVDALHTVIILIISYIFLTFRRL